ncbi:hypothetical protein V1499_19010 [Neobacillus sp. SCS-31]|uniref:hypothetical protein n=1 Tax=Neobacillus oceani TaxID=3115292 RepID=UPI003906C071
MRDNLENLKEKMDKTILKDINFGEGQHHKVLNSVRKTKFQKDQFRLKSKLNSLLSITVISLMFLSITYFVGKELAFLNEPTIEKENVEDFNKTSNEKTVFIPTKKEENYNEMTKEEILTKMINTVDYFETAAGEYKIHNSSVPGYEIVKYALSLGNEPGGYGERIQGDGEIFAHEFYKDGTLWMIDERSKIYYKSVLAEGGEQKGSPLTLKQAFSASSDGVPETVYRERPPLGIANATLFPYEIASNYTRDLNKWEIEKQNEELLGHNTLVIRGTKNHKDFQSFRFWVDKDTGILAKYETYNSKGDIVDYLHPIKLDINVPIDSEKFTPPNLEGYKDYESLRQEAPKITTGNIDTLIPEELKGQWEEAKTETNETTVLQYNGNWYIFVKKGYLVNYIEVNGKEGTVYLVKASPQKAQNNFHAFAEGYKVDSLKIVYK